MVRFPNAFMGRFPSRKYPGKQPIKKRGIEKFLNLGLHKQAIFAVRHASQKTAFVMGCMGGRDLRSRCGNRRVPPCAVKTSAVRPVFALW